MGHIGEARGGAVVMGCKVLPMWRESGGMVDGARKTMVHGKKAVARVKELLRRAAQPRSPHPHPQATGASRWKVNSFTFFNSFLNLPTCKEEEGR